MKRDVSIKVWTKFWLVVTEFLPTVADVWLMVDDFWPWTKFWLILIFAKTL
jgi:hypothetical protein